MVPSGFDPDARGGAAQDWYPTRGLNCDNHRERVAAVLPDVEDLVRREQTNFGVTASRTVLIGFSQGGTVALEAVKTPGHRRRGGRVLLALSRACRRAARASRSRIHLVHGEYDSVVSRVYAERAARVLAGLHVPVTLDIVEDLGHALSHRAISLGSLRLLQGIYEAAAPRCIEGRASSSSPTARATREWARPFERIAAALGDEARRAASRSPTSSTCSRRSSEAVAALAAQGRRGDPRRAGVPRPGRPREGGPAAAWSRGARRSIRGWRSSWSRRSASRPSVIEAIASAIARGT